MYTYMNTGAGQIFNPRSLFCEYSRLGQKAGELEKEQGAEQQPC